MRHLLGLLLGAVVSAAVEDHAFFEANVRPILVEHCYECHSGVNSKGGLLLDTRQGWEKGGDSGAAIVPGQPDESLVIAAIRYHDEDLAMPPKKKGGRLPEAVIATFVEWVRMGAPDPRLGEKKIAGMGADEANSRWAFQPLAKAGATKSIDDFLDAKLAEAKLPPAPTADPRTLVRRLSYGLTGLPPTAEDVEAFAKDPWLAGAGVKRGIVHGATDEIGLRAVEKPVHVRDFHAPLLHLMGFDHHHLTYRHAGLDFRLTGVKETEVLEEVLA